MEVGGGWPSSMFFTVSLVSWEWSVLRMTDDNWWRIFIKRELSDQFSNPLPPTNTNTTTNPFYIILHHYLQKKVAHSILFKTVGPFISANSNFLQSISWQADLKLPSSMKSCSFLRASDVCGTSLEWFVLLASHWLISKNLY